MFPVHAAVHAAVLAVPKGNPVHVLAYGVLRSLLASPVGVGSPVWFAVLALYGSPSKCLREYHRSNSAMVEAMSYVS